MGEPLTLTPGIPTPVGGGRRDKQDKGGKLRNGPVNKTQICGRKRREGDRQVYVRVSPNPTSTTWSS